MFLNTFDFGIVPEYSKNSQRKKTLDDLLLDFYTYDHKNNYKVYHKINDDKSLTFALDVPGVEEKDLSIEVLEDNLLNISFKRKTLKSSHSFNKSFTIPDMYDTASIEANLKDGVLMIHMKPLPEKQKEVRKILINKS